jgi:amidase
MTTFITKLDTTGNGVRVAVKDIIDVEGVPTTAGSRALERRAEPAAADAACLAGARAAGARLVGKANLHELAMLPFGTNPWFGTPVNPLDAALLPGGSSSGSSVAVATGEADVALGSDTGGSIRVPSACCGTTGLKTTYGRIPLDGVWPLAPSLDTVGPMATTIEGLVTGMQLLEPGFTPSAAAAQTVGRLRTAGAPEIERAVDEALAAAGVDVVPLEWAGLDIGAGELFPAVFFSEVWEVDHALAKADTDGVGEDIQVALSLVEVFGPGLAEARARIAAWRQSLVDLFDRVEVLALPTMPIFPPRLEELGPDTLMSLAIDMTLHVAPFNVAGLPCTAQPVPVTGSRLPASIELVGRPGAEELLLPTAQRIEDAVGGR